MFFSRIHREAVLRNLTAIAVSNIFLQLLGFGYRIFLSRVTGAEGMGVYQLVMPFYSLLSSLSLTGLTVSVAKLSAERKSAGDILGARSSVPRASRLFTLALVTLGAVTFFSRDFIGNSFLGDARVLPSLPFLFVCLFLTGLENIMKNYFYGVGRVAPQITSELSEQLVRAFAVAALLLSFSPKNAAASSVLIICGMIASELVSALLLSLFFLCGKTKKQIVSIKKPPFRSFLKIALPISASRGANNLLSTFTCALIPTRLRASGLSPRAATESFGITFGMTMPLLSFPIAFIAALSSVMMPKISEAYAKKDFSDARRKAGKTIHATSLLALPLCAVMLPLGKPLGTLLFKNEGVGELILPLSIATLISFYEISFGAILNATGHEKRNAVYETATGLLGLFFTWLIGIPGLGMRAFAIGSVVCGGICASLQFSSLCHALALKPRFDNWFFTPFLAAFLSAVIADVAYTLSGSLPLAFTLSLASYLLALFALGTNPIKYIRTLVPKK
ncbi:MAG: oligosaccharide flippase family protein [Oscillospiraceae bacterium]|nr:oligosaccharide flippase family protein [Oscillospiraceae bacterium]